MNKYIYLMIGMDWFQGHLSNQKAHFLSDLILNLVLNCFRHCMVVFDFQKATVDTVCPNAKGEFAVK